MPSPREAYERAARGTWICTSVEPSLCSFESVHPLSRVFGFLSSAFPSDKVGLHRFCPPATLTLTTPAAEGKPSHCSTSHGTLSQWLRLSYLAVTFFFFFNIFGGDFLFPSPPPSLTSPFSDLWGLLLSRALKESLSHWTGPGFSHHCPAVTPKKGASCRQCPVERGCVSDPTWCSVGASPHQGFVIAALKENALSFLLATACCFLSIAPAQTPCPSPSKALCSHLLAMSCGAFLLRKRSLANRREWEK